MLFFLFFLHSYCYSMSASYLHVRSLVILTGDQPALLYRYDLLPYAAGMLLFGLWHGLKNGKSGVSQQGGLHGPSYSYTAATISLLCSPLYLITHYTDSDKLFLGAAFLLMFFTGVLCAYVYSHMARALKDNPKICLQFCIAISLAILLQYLLQATGSNALIPYTQILAAFGTAAIIIRQAQSRSSSSDPASHTNESAGKASLLNHGLIPFAVSVFATICMELIGNFMTSSLLLVTTDQAFMSYAYPRLFIISGYLLAGFAAHKANMRYLPAVTMCGVLVAVLNPILFFSGASSGSQILNICIFYACAGIINSYLTLSFWKLSHSPASFFRWTALISVTGKILDALFSCIFSSPMLQTLSLPVIIGIELALIILMMLIFSFTGQFSFASPAVMYSRSLPSPKEFGMQFHFTEKEQEVFSAAIAHNGTTSDLAKSLYLSRSVLYRHLGSICKKTECGNFEEVKRMYYETPDVSPVSNALAAKDHLDISTETEANITPNTKMDSSIKIDTDGNMDSRMDNSTEAGTDISAETLQKPSFALQYGLSEQESETLQLLIKNPGMTQKELAAIRGVTLRTMQRHLGGIRQKTGTSSLPEVMALYYRS
ncbi:MAG: helix-turn-helix transcriptional regulator [Lachnospiraceae bacterium]|nr:helix-turn-helix transcriptional regulator [Lachnospiraceae bacterium]